MIECGRIIVDTAGQPVPLGHTGRLFRWVHVFAIEATTPGSVVYLGDTSVRASGEVRGMPLEAGRDVLIEAEEHEEGVNLSTIWIDANVDDYGVTMLLDAI